MFETLPEIGEYDAFPPEIRDWWGKTIIETHMWSHFTLIPHFNIQWVKMLIAFKKAISESQGLQAFNHGDVHLQSIINYYNLMPFWVRNHPTIKNIVRGLDSPRNFLMPYSAKIVMLNTAVEFIVPMDNNWKLYLDAIFGNYKPPNITSENFESLANMREDEDRFNLKHPDDYATDDEDEFETFNTAEDIRKIEKEEEEERKAKKRDEGRAKRAAAEEARAKAEQAADKKSGDKQPEDKKKKETEEKKTAEAEQVQEVEEEVEEDEEKTTVKKEKNRQRKKVKKSILEREQDYQNEFEKEYREDTGKYDDIEEEDPRIKEAKNVKEILDFQQGMKNASLKGKGIIEDYNKKFSIFFGKKRRKLIELVKDVKNQPTDYDIERTLLEFKDKIVIDNESLTEHDWEKNINKYSREQIMGEVSYRQYEVPASLLFFDGFNETEKQIIKKVFNFTDEDMAEAEKRKEIITPLDDLVLKKLQEESQVMDELTKIGEDAAKYDEGSFNSMEEMYKTSLREDDQKLRITDDVGQRDVYYKPPPDPDVPIRTYDPIPVDYFINEDGFWDNYIKYKRDLIDIRELNVKPLITLKPKLRLKKDLL